MKRKKGTMRTVPVEVNLLVKLSIASCIVTSSLLFIGLVQCDGSTLLAKTNGNESPSPASTITSTPTNDDSAGEKIIAKKVTIFVGDEEPPTKRRQQQGAPEKTTAACVENVQQSESTRNTTKKAEPKFYLDELTKLIYIDESNESGYLVGEINNGSEESQFSHNEPSAGRPAASNSKGSKKNNPNGLFDRFHNARTTPAPTTGKQQQVSGDGSSPTNYTVFLVSRRKEHIALLLDIEEIDFEPIINCEYQELRFGIVGEISAQLLNRKHGSESGETDDEAHEAAGAFDDEDDDVEGGDDSQGQSEHVESTVPPLPVSEAMSMLLNSPLNKTILDPSSETNDFRVIDSTIDFLHEETCHELTSAKDSAASDRQEQKQSKRRRPRTEPEADQPGRKSCGRKQRRPKGSRARQKQQPTPPPPPPAENTCPQESRQFKEAMASKLNDYFEWDDFKIVCGKTKQLVIPMRSMRLSVYSDEFSPNSRFVLRYRFISDPELLPAHDNGKYYCRNRNIIELGLKCNGIDDCGDASDESIKVCGYPTSRGSSGEPTLPSPSVPVPQANNGSHSPSSAGHHGVNTNNNKPKLTYVSGDVLHCCQSNDWLSIMPQTGESSQAVNLQSLIGESMNLFSGPSFAPTRGNSHGTSRSQQGRRRVKRIVGGSVAQRGAWPGQASLQYELIEPLCHFCAGTLIHPQYVLTAGHCITKDGLSRGIKVVFGAHDLRQLGGNHIQVRYVDDAQIYPGVDVKHLSFDWENDMNNDIALLRLNAPVLITPHVAPACLPPFDTPLSVNTTCRSIGWGQTHGSGSSNLLKHLSLKVVDSSFCSKELFDRDGDDNTGGNNTTSSDKHSFGGGEKKSRRGSANQRRQARAASLASRRTNRNRPVSDYESAAFDQYSDLTMVCVNNDIGHGICQGDSGGPLYCDRVTSNTGEHCTEIYGVASFIIQYATVGAMCAVENLPGIFGEVSSKTEWISSTIKMFEQTYRLKYS